MKSQHMLIYLYHVQVKTKEHRDYTHVLNRVMESCVGWISFAGGLVQRGGEFDSWVGMAIFGKDGGVAFGVEGAEVFGVSGADEILGFVDICVFGVQGAMDLTVPIVIVLGVLGTGGMGIIGGGVCGESISSEVRAGLPSPDSLFQIKKLFL